MYRLLRGERTETVAPGRRFRQRRWKSLISNAGWSRTFGGATALTHRNRSAGVQVPAAPREIPDFQCGLVAHLWRGDCFVAPKP